MPHEPLPTSAPPWQAQPPAAARTPSGLVAVVIAVALVSLLALGLAAAAWFRGPAKASDKFYSEQERTTALNAVCSAHVAVKRALTAATNQPEGKQPGNTLLVAVNIRLAEYASADYLSQQLAAYPAAPEAVSSPAVDLVAALRRLAMGQLGDTPVNSLDLDTRQVVSLNGELTQACRGHT